MKTLVVLSVIGLLSGLAQAEEPKRLTVEQVILVYNGLSALDGWDDVCHDGAVEKSCRRPYKLSGSVRITIALNLAAAKGVFTAYSIARQALIVQYSNGGKSIPDEDIAKFSADDRKALNQESSITFGRLKRDDLKLDDNPIPGSVIALLLPIMD